MEGCWEAPAVSAMPCLSLTADEAQQNNRRGPAKLLVLIQLRAADNLASL